MATNEAGGSAFPSHGSMGEVTQEGMTLRDYFAAKAPDLPAWFRVEMQEKYCGLVDEKRIYFLWRWYYADGMLKARG